MLTIARDAKQSTHSYQSSMSSAVNVTTCCSHRPLRFMWHFFKICGPYKHQICGGNRGKGEDCVFITVKKQCVYDHSEKNCIVVKKKSTKSFPTVSDQGRHCPSWPSLPFSCQNEYSFNKKIKTAVENANLCGKICDMCALLKYAKNAERYEICGNRIFA